MRNQNCVFCPIYCSFNYLYFTMFCKFIKIKNFSIKQAEAADLINNEVKILNNKKKGKRISFMSFCRCG
jgi:hypothetical protein